ncbi:NAD(P)H-dependent flavin oxidoreductase [Entomomonas asaccharolytica]|uniref:Nitronate monooxygenase n=1 Tax=Entomomonas asaccharolytica TaxID=2785331 RepID=A0A974NEI1_9GAMM|nr:nitronate monooxygenase [Entomomonas asaccharolytica]QQP84987.1 nitronate monooxygenase [Entomomonas asaccharolytica]
MKNIITLLDVNIPIIQAPMAGVQDSQLAIAVSNAGGLGSLPCSMLSVEELHQQLTIIKEQTKKPINLNFFCHKMTEPNQQQQAAWFTELAPFLNKYQIDPSTINIETNRRPFGQEQLDVLAEFKPKVVSFHFGLPDKNLLDQLKEWGTTILSTATTIEEALYLQANGADVIIAQGLEAGGHRGMFLTDDLMTQIGTMALVPQVVAAVNIPVIATGGIANANCVKAAMTLGASGVQVGTSYLLCPEAKTSLLHRQAILSDEIKHTAITNIFTGKPARALINKAIQEIGPLNSLVPSFPYATPAMAALRQIAESQDSNNFTPLWASQNISGCNIIPAAEITKQLAKGI